MRLSQNPRNQDDVIQEKFGAEGSTAGCFVIVALIGLVGWAWIVGVMLILYGRFLDGTLLLLGTFVVTTIGVFAFKKFSPGE
jgi:hypothetical protein